MSMNLKVPTKEVDVGLLVFIERYVTDLLRWDLLVFFAHHPDFSVSASKIAQHLNRSVHSIRPELGDLTMLGILDQKRDSEGQILYQLTKEPYLQKMILKFADQLAVPTAI